MNNQNGEALYRFKVIEDGGWQYLQFEWGKDGAPPTITLHPRKSDEYLLPKSQVPAICQALVAKEYAGISFFKVSECSHHPE